MATAKGTMSVAKMLQNIPLQKVIGPESVEVVNMESFWATQVCLSSKLLCGDFPTDFYSHDKSKDTNVHMSSIYSLSASLLVFQSNISHAVGFHTKAGFFCACRTRFCSLIGIPHA